MNFADLCAMLWIVRQSFAAYVMVELLMVWECVGGSFVCVCELDSDMVLFGAGICCYKVL